MPIHYVHEACSRLPVAGCLKGPEGLEMQQSWSGPGEASWALVWAVVGPGTASPLY